MIKDNRIIVIILTQLFLSLYLSLYAFYKILVIEVLDLLVPLKIICAGLLFLICFFSINILIYRFVSIVKKQKEGVYKLPSKEYSYWVYKSASADLMQTILNLVPGNNALFILLYKALGAKLNLDSMISKYSLSDPEFISIGKNTIIGRDAMVTSHIIEKGLLIIKKIKIGNNCTIGAKSMICPGVIIEDGAIIAANSFVVKNQKIKKGELWGGSPARMIKKVN